MTAANFDPCMREVFSHEGGYVHHPSDPGGETNMGISKRSYPREDIRGMTQARASQIYRRDFWDKVRADEMPDGLDLVAFDASVNSGVSRGARWLQVGLGFPPPEQDGRVGPNTVGRAQSATDGVKVIQKACAARMGFLRGLKSLWTTFSRGWTRRVASVEATAVAMNTRSAVAVRQEGAKANSTAAKQATGAAGTSTGGAVGTSGLDGAPDIVTYGLAAVAIIVVLVLVSKAIVNRERAKAYHQKEKELSK